MNWKSKEAGDLPCLPRQKNLRVLLDLGKHWNRKCPVKDVGAAGLPEQPFIYFSFRYVEAQYCNEFKAWEIRPTAFWCEACEDPIKIPLRKAHRWIPLSEL